jgi:hypothetical protein
LDNLKNICRAVLRKRQGRDKNKEILGKGGESW